MWQISTFAAMGAAIFLAFHPLSSGSPPQAGGPASASAKAASTGSGDGLFSSLFGGGGSAAAPVAHTGTHLEALNAARNATEQCEALGQLGAEAAGDQQAISAITERTAESYPRTVRFCAIHALEQLGGGPARSFLGELVNDKDPHVRAEALRALASKANEDADALSIVTAAAHSDDRDTRTEALLALGEAHVPQASALIQAALAGESGEAQARLVYALGETRDPAAVATLSKMLDDTSSGTRRAALEALGAIGGADAVATLESSLENGSRADVQAAAQALARTGDPGAKSALIAAAQSSRRSEQVAALQALAQVDGPEVRDTMLKALRGTDSQTVAMAASWFSGHGDRTAIPELAALAKTAPQSARGSILSVLASMGGDEARDAVAQMAKTPGPDQGTALSQLMNMNGGKEQGRKIALQMLKDGGQNGPLALSLLGQDGTPEARDALVEVARGGGQSAAMAMNALAQQGDPQAMRSLGDMARSGKTPEIRARALGALAQAGDPKVTPTLLSAVRDGDVGVSRAAVAGLARVGGPDAERALIDATNDKDQGTRLAAVRSLGRIETPTAASQLERFASGKGEVAQAAYETLITSAPDRAAAVADRAMSTGDAQMRAVVVQNASSLPGDAGKRILLSAVRDADNSVVMNAIDGLANVGGTDAQSAIVDLLGSDSAPADTKRAAADALDRIGGDAAKQHRDLIDKYKSTPGRDGDEGVVDAEDGPDVID
ncbi:MAG TPA: HEAT repeat domain-containing protein [Polyangiaceae bacterium]|nr:HEAT repeat domain-containing protein [Polyangiaceae bacterium]